MVSRARKRKIAATPTRTFEWGGSAPTKEAMAAAKSEMQERLIARYPSSRLGPIEWRVYDGELADKMLADSGMPRGASRAADGLRAFIEATSGAQLIVGAVMVRRDAILV